MTGSPLEQVTRFVLRRDIVGMILGILAQAGQRGEEAFVLLGGSPAPEMVLDEALRPDQSPTTTEHGLMVAVTGDALLDANLHFHRVGKTIAAQVHAHPGEAYHSKTDDTFPLVTLRGSLSVVVPDFASGGLADRHRWATYRLLGYQEWRQCIPDEVEVRT